MVIALALAVSLAGCNAIQLAYDNSPAVGSWWLNGYFEFSDVQRATLRGELTRLLAWHRQTELPKLIVVLQKAEALVSNDLTPALVCDLFDDVRTRVVAVIEHAEAPASVMAASLGQEQLQSLERKFAQIDAEYAEEWIGRTTVRQQEERYEGFLKRSEEFYGRLDTRQRTMLRQLVARSMFDAKHVDAERKRRQQEALQMLRQLQSVRVSTSDAQSSLQAYLERIVNPRAGARSDDPQRTLEEGCENVAALHNATRPDQRRRARDRLRAYEADLRELAAK